MRHQRERKKQNRSSGPPEHIDRHLLFSKGSSRRRRRAPRKGRGREKRSEGGRRKKKRERKGSKKSDSTREQRRREKLGGVVRHTPSFSPLSRVAKALSTSDSFSNEKKEVLYTRSGNWKTARGRGSWRKRAPAGGLKRGQKRENEWRNALPLSRTCFSPPMGFFSVFLAGPRRGGGGLCNCVGKKEKEQETQQAERREERRGNERERESDELSTSEGGRGPRRGQHS